MLQKFHKPFTSNRQGKFNLEELNVLRERVVEPLAPFFSQRKTKVNCLNGLTEFLQEAQLSESTSFDQGSSFKEQERYDQVCKTFLHVLEELSLVFEDQELTVDDFFSSCLIRHAIVTIPTVPATVDVVTVQSHDLIEPFDSPFMSTRSGWTQERFPKIAQNTSLLSEEERQQLNEAPRRSRAQVVTSENLKKNRFVAVSYSMQRPNNWSYRPLAWSMKRKIVSLLTF